MRNTLLCHLRVEMGAFSSALTAREPFFLVFSYFLFSSLLLFSCSYISHTSLPIHPHQLLTHAQVMVDAHNSQPVMDTASYNGRE